MSAIGLFSIWGLWENKLLPRQLRRGEEYSGEQEEVEGGMGEWF